MPPVSQDPLYLFGKVKQDWAVSGCEITITGNNKCLNPIVHSCKRPPQKKTTDKRNSTGLITHSFTFRVFIQDAN